MAFAHNRSMVGHVRSKKMIERLFNEAVRLVHCQQFFASRRGSQYFELCQPEEAKENQASAMTGEALSNQVGGRADDTLGGGGERVLGDNPGRAKERGESVAGEIG